MNYLKKLKKWEDLADYPTDADIYLEVDSAETFYVIISGEVELTINDDVLSTESAGGIIGEMAIIDGALQGAKASAVTDVKAARFSRPQLRTFMIENPEFSLTLMEVLARRLRLVDEYNTTDFECEQS
jgi:CRP/FNR family cyclic AMP-dependent transcriptional regulator